jgi:hypothetical protein
VIDLSEETLKALTMPSRRPHAILQHLQRQGKAIQDMQNKIRDQIRRLQVEESYLKKKLNAAPLEVDDIESPAPVPIAMDVDPKTTPKPSIIPRASKPKVTKSVLAPPDSSDEEEDNEEVDLPPSLRNASNPTGSYFMDEDNYEDDDDDAMDEVRRILQAHR